jgi:hypothetical protein
MVTESCFLVFVKVLSASGVTAIGNNTINITVTDVVDGKWDSTIFLKVSSDARASCDCNYARVLSSVVVAQAGSLIMGSRWQAIGNWSACSAYCDGTGSTASISFVRNCADTRA